MSNLPEFTLMIYPKQTKIRIGTKKVWSERKPSYVRKSYSNFDEDFEPSEELLQIAYEVVINEGKERYKIFEIFEGDTKIKDKDLFNILIDKIIDDGIMTEEQTISFRKLCR